MTVLVASIIKKTHG